MVHVSLSDIRLMITVATCFLACKGTEGQLLSFDDPSQAGATSVGGTSPSVPPREVESWPQPPLDADFQLQLTGALELGDSPPMIVLDLHSPSAARLNSLQASGSFVACYFSASSHEPWRDDAADFPEAALGDPLPDYPEERWLDIEHEEVLEPMRRRIALAQSRGCDAVYASVVRPAPDALPFGLNQESYSNFAAWLAKEAHGHGLAALYAGGATFDAEALDYDAALVFGCVSAGSCVSWSNYRAAGAPVYLVELASELETPETCGLDRPMGWPLIVKTPQLGPERVVCQ